MTCHDTVTTLSRHCPVSWHFYDTIVTYVNDIDYAMTLCHDTVMMHCHRSAVTGTWFLRQVK